MIPIKYILSTIVGLALFCLTAVLLWTILRAYPDGTIVVVNRAWGEWEFIGDVISVVGFGLLGLGFAIYSFHAMVRK
jgi:hypothetical protein